MKLKKIFTAILMVLVILSLGASYVLTAFSPRASAPAPSPIAPTSENLPVDTGYTVPTTPPSVKGPTTAPSSNSTGEQPR